MNRTTVPQSSYPDPYIPALNNLWCHTGNKQPEGKTNKQESMFQCDVSMIIQRFFVLTFKFISSKHLHMTYVLK